MNIKPIKTFALLGSFAAALLIQPAAQAETPYQVDGNKVDKATFGGWIKDNKAVADGIDGLYAFLKGRSDGAIPAGELQEMP